MRSVLRYIAVFIALALTLVVCAHHVGFIPWVLLGLYLAFRLRRRRKRDAEHRAQSQQALALAQAEAAEEQAYRRWRRQQSQAQMAADGVVPAVAPTSPSRFAEQEVASRRRLVPRSQRWR